MMAPDAGSYQRGTKRPRTRHGCVNCKTKRRKCDEAKPTCGRCSNKSEQCQWAPRLIFRAENALGVAPSMLRRPPGRVPTRFRIKDVTAEVIRDYQHDEPGDEADVSDDPQAPASTNLSPSTSGEQSMPFQDDLIWQRNTPYPSSVDDIAHLSSHELCHLPTPVDVGPVWHSPIATGLLDENVFLPGSAYLSAHSTFRDHLIQEVRSNLHTREVTPDTAQDTQAWPSDTQYNPMTNRNTRTPLSLDDTPIENLHFSPAFTLQLSDEEEFVLWKNWVDEIAPWVDKFDSERHFQHTLPIMARSHDHLRYSMLAVSARQLERKNHSKHTERSLALYQTAIQLVLPQLHTRSTPVIASCVVLCILEMLSSSAQAWHQHLDGCAHLIEAIGINGFAGGVNQALFWCFARMDVCGGLIASSKTLIPVDRWASGIDLDTDVDLFQANNDYNTHACQAVYLCAQVLNLLSFHTGLAERVGASPPSTEGSNEAYIARWQQLWHHISSWYTTRPAEMLPISSITSSTSPFPKLLYSNPAAVSGNQLYHTASVLMLRHKPSGATISPKPQSIFWHARQICGISMSNDHHGAWTNAIQPLWIAGQWMSHESEQKAILELFERIETETGWGTKWRAEDLKEFWG